MDFDMFVLRLQHSAPPAVILEGIDLLSSLTDVVDLDPVTTCIRLREGGAPPVEVILSPRHRALCSCGDSSTGPWCAHIVAAQIHVALSDQLMTAEDLQSLQRRAQDHALHDEARSLLVTSHLQRSDHGEEIESARALAAVCSPQEAMRLARDISHQAGPEASACFLAAVIDDQLHGVESSISVANAGKTFDLVRALTAPDIGLGPDESVSALLRLLPLVRASFSDPRDPSVWFLQSYALLVRRLASFAHTGALDVGVVAAAIAVSELSSSVSYPVLGGIADQIDPGRGGLLLEIHAAVTRMAEGDVPPEKEAVRKTLLVESAFAARSAQSFHASLTARSEQQLGLYFRRALPDAPLSFRAAIAQEAFRSGRLRWAPGWPSHLPGMSIPGHTARSRAATEREVIRQAHTSLAHHPAWERVAIGDAAEALAEVGGTEQAREAPPASPITTARERTIVLSSCASGSTWASAPTARTTLLGSSVAVSPLWRACLLRLPASRRTSSWSTPKATAGSSAPS